MLVASRRRWALIHEERDADHVPELLIRRMEPVDILLIEGWKKGSHEKIEVHRPSLGYPLLAIDDPSIVAIASDVPLSFSDRPVLPLDDASAIAEFVLDRLGLVENAA